MVVRPAASPIAIIRSIGTRAPARAAGSTTTLGRVPRDDPAAAVAARRARAAPGRPGRPGQPEPSVATSTALIV